MKQDFVTMHLVGEEFPQFNKKSNGTLVFEKPEAEFLLDVMSTQIKKLAKEQFDLKVGASFLHPEDQLNRKVGRAMAMARMRDVKFTVDMHTYGIGSDSTWLFLEGVDEVLKAKYSISVKIYKDSRKLRVVGAHMRILPDDGK